MRHIRNFLKKIIPRSLFNKLAPSYHFSLAWLGSIVYGSPSKKLKIIGVTGTKGKSSVTEIMSAVLEEAGYSTAVSGTVRFKVGKDSQENMLKQSMPGRFFLQKFLHRCVKENIDWVVIEMTSEGAKQFRNRFIYLDALIYTNLEPEHIESHGSYENYRAAKKSIIVNSLEKSKKKNRALIVNRDDSESGFFLLDSNVEEKITYGLDDIKNLKLTQETIDFDLDDDHYHSELSGEFNAYNLLACITLAKHIGLADADIQRAVMKFNGVPGRVQRIQAGQDFAVVVDYAHTPQSLEKLYETFAESKRICVLGNTGGGRDTWKRPKMAEIANRHCSEIILTNEDPYDEDPQKIIDDMVVGINDTPYQVILDRRKAIAAALAMAKTGDSVLITGKGTDPYIMGPNNSKLEWSDARVAREELEALLKKKV
mgnify:CR=1 FL=1